MIESEWLSSTNPAPMFHVGLEERGLATEERCYAFVEACRSRWLPSHGIWNNGAIKSDMAWCLKEWTHLGAMQSGPSPENQVARAALLRDIFGNPFRPVQMHDECMIEPPCRQRMDYICENCRTSKLDAWLSWNGGTVVKLAREIRGGEGYLCESYGMFESTADF